jgi:hypothetical protein
MRLLVNRWLLCGAVLVFTTNSLHGICPPWLLGKLVTDAQLEEVQRPAQAPPPRERSYVETALFDRLPELTDFRDMLGGAPWQHSGEFTVFFNFNLDGIPGTLICTFNPANPSMPSQFTLFSAHYRDHDNYSHFGSEAELVRRLVQRLPTGASQNFHVRQILRQEAPESIAGDLHQIWVGRAGLAAFLRGFRSLLSSSQPSYGVVAGP